MWTLPTLNKNEKTVNMGSEGHAAAAIATFVELYIQVLYAHAYNANYDATTVK